ncbi:biotin--[acetyl-CoA-carboxylase] ligase [Nitrolancea hollandica]|uniref:Putative Biotin-(Acetyl-CoA carboxylase) ligase n=1 Tax=Nitrolancea hollandica Lb TaxID=1129897 RepID=I4EIT4_9BACT|nr:biotin--[acetyl-CoA-carboxylase] ligase [Nitrolancea hollandica]CCF84596.1 putative Biotin-(acetyl-CoA carboxylase) ligase [Nitrolancea hollandica Lb]
MEWRIERYETVGSTMEIAAGHAVRGAPAGLVVIAEEQTTGRGRLGRVWLAPPGTSLLLTALFRPSLEAARSSELSRLIAQRAGDAIAEVTGVRARIKDPNDLLIDGKKIAGILCQTSIRGDQLDYLLVGIGLNVNIPPDQLPFPTATSLLAVTGIAHDRELLLSAFLARLADLPELTCADVEP